MLMGSALARGGSNLEPGKLLAASHRSQHKPDTEPFYRLEEAGTGRHKDVLELLLNSCCCVDT